MTKQNNLQPKTILDDDANHDLLIEKIADFFSNPQFTELMATDPDKAFAAFGLDPQEVYRVLRNPTNLSQVLKRKVNY